MIRVDSHFHPNFKWRSHRSMANRASQIWGKFGEHKLDAVFVSEHSFKNPTKSYFELKKNKPKDHPTHLIPAVEAVTKEGIDMVVFSKDEYIYTQPDVLSPHHYTIDELMNRVSSDDQLHGIITHPFILSDTALIHHHEEAFIRKAISKMGYVEKHNAALIPLKRFLELTGLRFLAPPLYRRLHKVEHVPDEFIDDHVVVLGGGDSHHPRDIGNCLNINTNGTRYQNYDALFAQMIDPSHERTFTFYQGGFPLPVYLAFNGISIFFETMKKRLRLYRTDSL